MKLSELWNGQFWQKIFEGAFFSGDFWINILDFLIVWFLFYCLVKALVGTKESQLFKGILILLIARWLSGGLGLITITWLMDQVMTYGIIAIIIIFQPELRKILEKFGRKTMFNLPEVKSKEQILLVYEKTITYLSKRRIGALISIERHDSMQEYIETGIYLDAELTEELLINIFIPNTPLHDGAVIIKDKKIIAASAYFPLTGKTKISKEYGTRHRAAIGISELVDAVTIVVSEETGGISLTKDGAFLPELTLEDTIEILRNSFVENEEDDSKSFFFYSFFDKIYRKKGEKR
ncbi:MAG: diadenylate cyclase CdaA [Lactobacillales bacterium]|jgi:diadenylate cyclase|nr:diadenylate cyclase CdaA [Lactobacillales bacterium]